MKLGLITYMRTDSVNLSQEARNTCSSRNFFDLMGTLTVSLVILKENLKGLKKLTRPFALQIFQHIQLILKEIKPVCMTLFGSVLLPLK